MNKKKEKQPGKGLAAFVIILIAIVSRLLREGSFRVPPAAISVAAVALVGLVCVISVVAVLAKKSKASGGSAASSVRQSPSVPLSRPVPSMQRREPVTAQRNFQKPEAYCITCENTGDDHFVRDRARRIAQLDEWLKNGIVDKQEYLVLKYRFERDQ